MKVDLNELRKLLNEEMSAIEKRQASLREHLLSVQAVQVLSKHFPEAALVEKDRDVVDCIADDFI